MQHTTNYNLPIYESGDVTSWLTVFNNAMQAIDTAIFTAKSTADSASSSVSALSATVGDHTTAITALTSSLSEVATALNTVTGTLNTVTSLIGNGEPTTTDKTIIGAINELHADIQGISTPEASDVSFDNTSTDLQSTNVEDAIKEVNDKTGQTSANVRWNSVTDRFEVLKNGSWVQSIKAFVNSIAVWVAGQFGIGTDNGVYKLVSQATIAPFGISGNNLYTNPTTNNSGSTLVSTDLIDFSNYSTIKVKTNHTTTPDVSLNVSGYNGTGYLAVAGWQGGSGARLVRINVISEKEDYASHVVDNLEAEISGFVGQIEISEITVE